MLPLGAQFWSTFGATPQRSNLGVTSGKAHTTRAKGVAMARQKIVRRSAAHMEYHMLQGLKSMRLYHLLSRPAVWTEL